LPPPRRFGFGDGEYGQWLQVAGAIGLFVCGFKEATESKFFSLPTTSLAQILDFGRDDVEITIARRPSG
jgi:hypothetical protein